MSLLFVNACVRGDHSKTLTLCREYLDLVGRPYDEVDVSGLGLSPLDADAVAYRTTHQMAGDFDDPIFALSKQFCAADDIVVGAPYWDLSFPSVLKVYLEHVSVCDLAFRYTEDARCVGICKARSLVYITTCGGKVGANLGYGYFQGIADMFGIPETHCICAQDVDIVGIDVQAQLDEARAQMRTLLG